MKYYYYVYKITNLLNEKFYIGKRKHSDPENDSYMGSGKLITLAIKKYGRNNFIKEIISVFDCNEDASRLEKQLVTVELVKSGNCYNLHEGGHGGFAHINNTPKENRINLISLKNKILNGELTIGGTSNWTEYSFNKVRETAKRNNIEGLTSGWKHTENFKREQSIRSLGESNSQYGKRSYTNILTLEKKKFREQSDGWILTSEYIELKMINSRRWFNDGSKNFYILNTDPKIMELSLVKGRIKTA